MRGVFDDKLNSKEISDLGIVNIFDSLMVMTYESYNGIIKKRSLF